MSRHSKTEAHSHHAATLVIGIPEIRDVIEQYMTPSGTFKFISASPASFRAFVKFPQIYLTETISKLPEKVQPWAKVLAQITDKSRCDDSSPYCPRLEFCWSHLYSIRLRHIRFQKLFSMSPCHDDWRDVVSHMVEPIAALKTQAYVEETVENVANFDTLKRLYRLPASTNGMHCQWTVEDIKVELWRFELYRILFHRKVNALKAGTGTMVPCLRSWYEHRTRTCGLDAEYCCTFQQAQDEFNKVVCGDGLSYPQRQDFVIFESVVQALTRLLTRNLDFTTMIQHFLHAYEEAAEEDRRTHGFSEIPSLSYLSTWGSTDNFNGNV